MIALGAFFRGSDRTKPATLGWQMTSALVFGASLVASQQLVLGAAGLTEQTGSLNAVREQHYAILQNDGSVLVCGGTDYSQNGGAGQTLDSGRACAGRCGAPRPSCSGPASATG